MFKWNSIEWVLLNIFAVFVTALSLALAYDMATGSDNLKTLFVWLLSR